MKIKPSFLNEAVLLGFGQLFRKILKVFKNHAIDIDDRFSANLVENFG